MVGQQGPEDPSHLTQTPTNVASLLSTERVTIDPRFPAGGKGAAVGSGLDRTRDMLHWTTQTSCCRSNWVQSRTESPIHYSLISLIFKDNSSSRNTTAKQTRINDSHYGCQQPQTVNFKPDFSRRVIKGQVCQAASSGVQYFHF